MRIIIRAPLGCPKKEIEAFVISHSSWLENALSRCRKRAAIAEEYAVPPGKENEYMALAREKIPPRVEYWSNIMGLTPSAVKISKAQKRYGSCSHDNVLRFSYILVPYPLSAVDYTIVHELAHIVHKNHSREFYSLIEKYLPDYREREKILKHKERPND